jgi:hypothetical protein
MSTSHGGARLLPPQEQEFAWAKERRVVQAEAQSRLRNSGYYALRVVSCDFHEGVLTLRGQVPSFYLKQVAQELVRRLGSAEEVNNHLVVVLNGDGRETSQLLVYGCARRVRTANALAVHVGEQTEFGKMAPDGRQVADEPNL